MNNTKEEWGYTRYTRDDFIEVNRTNASLFKWLLSKGTNYTCYENYMNEISADKENLINQKIDMIRIIIYTINSPVEFSFFYWTLLIFMLHKFNFKKPVMKIILAHYILRTIGNILNKLGKLLPHYFYNKISDDVYTCEIDSLSPEKNPLRWFLTRQIACLFWRFGEIAADWYPLIRTKAVVNEQKSMWIVYLTCGFFNLTKISLIFLHFTLLPSELFNEKGEYDRRKVHGFYFIYWIIQLIIIYSSMIYEFSVYFVLKKNLSKLPHIKSNFLKKFKLYSEYRIYCSAFVSIIFLPIISLAIILKYFFYYYRNFKDLNFSFEDIRKSIGDFQYYMIFIDQILLMKSSIESSQQINLSTIHSSFYSFNNNNNKDNGIMSYGSCTTIPNQNINDTINTDSENHKNKLNDSTTIGDINNNSNCNVSFNNNNTNYNNNYNEDVNNYGDKIYDNNNSNNTNSNNNNNNNTNINNNEKFKYGSLNSYSNLDLGFRNRFSNNSINNDDTTSKLDDTIKNYIPERNNLNYETTNSDSSFKNKTLAHYDDYNGIKDEWSYLRK